MPCGYHQEGTFQPETHTNAYWVEASQGCPRQSEWIYSGTGPYGDYAGLTSQGTCTPDFHKRKREGELLPYTYWYKFQSEGRIRGSALYNFDNGACQETYTCNDWRLSHVGSDWAVGATDCNAILEGKDFDADYWLQSAASKAYSKGHDMLTFLAELGKTRDSFVNLLKKIRSRKPPKGTTSLANAWLEWRYSWRPLLRDMEDVTTAIQSLNETRLRTTEKAGLTTRWHEDAYDVVGDDDPNSNNVHSKRKTSYEVGVGGIVCADFQPPSFQFNIPVTAWELVPWSFVVDWAYSVGKALEAMSFITLASNYTAAKRWYVRIEKTESYWWEFVAPNWGPGTAACSCWSIGTMKFRVPSRVSLKPQIKPGWIDEDQVRDLLSFMQTGLKRGRRAQRR